MAEDGYNHGIMTDGLTDDGIRPVPSTHSGPDGDAPIDAGVDLNLDLNLGLDPESGTVQAKQRIVVAMSGGVDSSVVAALLSRAGHDVIGVTLQLYDHGTATGRKGACCAGADIRDAAAVAAKLGIPHYVLDYSERFRTEVMGDFADSYLRGETPVPCVRCNQTVKFRDLLDAARFLNADALATGHYVRRAVGPDGQVRLLTARDPLKDQSYFLFATRPDQLAFLRFPLGGLAKDRVRALAGRLELDVAAKPDSQDICFVPQGDYADIVAGIRADADAPGDIVHLDGRVLGRHRGIAHFTVGQRKGLGIGGRTTDTDPLYVIRLEPEGCRVIVGPRDALAVQALELRDVNRLDTGTADSNTDADTDTESAIDADTNTPAIPCMVKIRNSMQPAPAQVRPGPGNRAQVHFATPQYGVSPGQACVFYRGEEVLGGGWIADTHAANPCPPTPQRTGQSHGSHPHDHA